MLIIYFATKLDQEFVQLVIDILLDTLALLF